MRKYLENTGIVFSVSIILGLFLPLFCECASQLITVYLIVAMSLSLRTIPFSKKDIRKNMGPSLKALVVNYVFLSGITLLMAYLLVPEPAYFAGFVVMAAMPPAIAVVPFTYILGGDTKTSLGGEILTYLAALGLAPLITLSFLGSAVNVFEILWLLVLLILSPMLISRLLKKLKDSYFSWSRAAINICFGLIVYSIIGLNQDIILFQSLSLVPIMLILFVRTYVSGIFVYLFSKRIGSKRERAISYSLFASFKNGGMTATFSIILVGVLASLPAALMGIFELTFMVFMQRILRSV